MKNLKRWIRNFFGFSRSQTNGFVGLLVIISFALFSKPAYHAWVASRPLDFSNDRKVLDSLTLMWEKVNMEKGKIPMDEDIAKRLFKFNPNSVTEDELQALGFSAGLRKSLLNYRSKGGQFRVRSDLKKLYGMDSAFYKSLYPFIQLPEMTSYSKAILEEKNEIKKKPVAFNLNEADTSQFQQVYGIGPVLAKRIVKYRERLGGFVRNEQLHEVYGLDSVVIKKLLSSSFLPDNGSLRKLNINTADERLLSSHPYFSKKIAKVIVSYRFQHGNYQSVDDLRKITILEDKFVDKIYPYLTVE